MKLRLAILLFLSLGPPLLAQNSLVNLSQAGQCAPVQIASNTNTVGIQVSGTFSATLQPEVSINGQPWVNTVTTPVASTTSQSTITTAGVYTTNVAGSTAFQLCVTAYTSGTASVSFGVSSAVASSKMGGGGGSGTVTSVSGTTNQIDVANGTTTPVISFDPNFASGGLSFFGSGSTTSAQLLALLTNATGTGSAVFGTSPTLTTPSLTAITCGVLNTTSCVITGYGSTSGTATLTWPAVAGTATNPIVSSNILELPNGAATTPALVFANSTTNGLYSNASTVDCFAFGGTDSDCMGAATVGIKISSTGAYGFTQGSSASGTLGQSIGVAGSGATEVINPSTFLLLPQCKITSAITIGSTSSPVTICSFTLPNSAQTWAYQCTGTYQTSTSAITLTLGTEFSHAPTVSNHNAQIWSAANTSTFAGPITNTGTTAVTTLTGAAPASSTSVPWSASGSFTGNATSGTFILYGLASTASDAQINAGSTCQIY